MNKFDLQTEEGAKLFSIALSEQLKFNNDIVIGHSKLLHTIAKVHGHNNWHVMKSFLQNPKNESNSDSMSNYLLRELDKKTQFNVMSSITGLLSNSNDSWRKLALTSLGLTIDLYHYLKNEKKNTELKSIRDLANLDFIIKEFFQMEFENNLKVKKDVQAYLESIPGFSMDDAILKRIKTGVYEQHGYRTMNYISDLVTFDNDGVNNNYYLLDVDFDDSSGSIFEAPKMLIGVSCDSNINKIDPSEIKSIVRDICYQCKELKYDLESRELSAKMDSFGYKNEKITLRKIIMQ